jgi:DNA-binding XRE family transcriptional regulator
MAVMHEHEHVLALASARQRVASGQARSIRLRAGLSLYDIAGSIGTTATTVWRWEGGACLPRGGLAIRYGSLLDALAQQLGEPLNEPNPAGQPGSGTATTTGMVGDVCTQV